LIDSVKGIMEFGWNWCEEEEKRREEKCKKFPRVRPIFSDFRSHSTTLFPF